MDRGRAAWPGRGRPQDVPVRVHRRPLPGPDRVPVGPQRGHGPARGRAAPWHLRPRDPRVVYLDNGSAMISKQLLRALAVLGIQLTHSKPREPAGRGKIERVFRTVREQFLIELAVPGALAKITGLAQLNELFTAWVETVYHQRVHSETGQAPMARFTAADPPVLPTPAALHEAFLWSETRLVAKTATVSLFGNTYEV